MLNGKSILVTGGTGSFGQAFVGEVIRRYPGIKRLVVFSRDELKQYEMAEKFPESEHKMLRYFIGDVRDAKRVQRALKGIDIVVHAAALKQVSAAEYNPLEFIHTNILGSENVIEAAIDVGVRQVIALSTDKATAPVNLYGATKLCSDKLFVAANYYAGTEANFSVVRYGNVMGSRGSVVPFYLKKVLDGVLPITDPLMTRFSITLQEGINMVLWALDNGLGGEIFVPKIPSYRIIDLAEAIGPTCRREIVGIRPGEKLHEEMITENDSFMTLDLGRCFAILPTIGKNVERKYEGSTSVSRVPEGFSYHSGRNSEFLSVEQLRTLIRQHVDSHFEPI